MGVVCKAVREGTTDLATVRNSTRWNWRAYPDGPDHISRENENESETTAVVSDSRVVGEV